MAKSVPDKVALEIEEIDRHLAAYGDLWTKARQEDPDLVETTAFSTVLQSFYTGLEKIFTYIAKGIDGEVPSGKRWHQDLLDQMGAKTPNRKAVISPEMILKLDPYLDFRHYCRHGYSYSMDWEKMAELVLTLPEIWTETKEELHSFITGAT